MDVHLLKLKKHKVDVNPFAERRSAAFSTTCDFDGPSASKLLLLISWINEPENHFLNSIFLVFARINNFSVCKTFKKLFLNNRMANITKRELVVRITDKLGSQGVDITQRDVHEVVQNFIDEITESLAKGDTVILRNFGAFQVRETAAKVGRNPKEPEVKVMIPARASVKFKPGKEMKEKVATVLQLIREQNSSKNQVPS